MLIKTITVEQAIEQGYKFADMPKRGYFCQTQQETLFIARKTKSGLNKMIRSIENAFSPDKHLSVVVCTMKAA